MERLREIRQRIGEDPRVVFMRFRALLTRVQQALKDAKTEYIWLEELTQREICEILRLIFIDSNLQLAKSQRSKEGYIRVNYTTGKKLGEGSRLSTLEQWEEAINALHSKLCPPNMYGLHGCGYNGNLRETNEHAYLLIPRRSRETKHSGATSPHRAHATNSFSPYWAKRSRK